MPVKRLVNTGKQILPPLPVTDADHPGPCEPDSPIFFLNHRPVNPYGGAGFYAEFMPVDPFLMFSIADNYFPVGTQFQGFIIPPVFLFFQLKF